MPTWRIRLLDCEGIVHHLEVDAEASAPTAELVAGIERLGFGPVTFDQRPLDPGTALGQIGLRHGSLLRERATSASVPTAPSMPAGIETIRELVVLTGPSAGMVVGLRAGRTVIHPALALEVDPDGRVVLHPLVEPSTALLEGDPCGVGTELRLGTVASIGSTAFTVEAPRPSPTLDGGPGPTEPFVPRFRSARTPLPTRLTSPTPPSTPVPAWSGWWRSLLPLLTGIGFAVLTGRWEFLLLSALAPLVHVVDGRRERRRRDDENRRTQARYTRELAAFEADVAEVRDLERRRRRRDEPLGAGCVLLARDRSRDLWARRPGDTDFGRVTVGLAALVGDLDAGDAHRVTGRPRTWGLPLSAPLPDLGALVVTGPLGQARSVLRSVVIGLSTTHAPDDLEIWVVAAHPDGPADWEFARWLPHAVGPSGLRLGLDAPQRARCVAELRSILDARRTRSESGSKHPLVVVVIDPGAAPVDGDLREIVREGAGNGLVALVADDRLGLDGIGAELRLTGPGTASYSSRTQPLVTDVLVAELGRTSALETALALAPLASGGPSGLASGPTSDGRLLGLLGLDDLDVDGLLDRWHRRSPSTAVPIGWSGDAVMEVDLVAHGPHGLLAGMSGSGKTELLMTLLTSLCLDNHPDDLALVVVDFKGGVDHEVTARLPHVVSLSTNLGIDELRRTIALLDAEQRRRQRLLRGVAPDLDAYRAARTRDASLPPLPRLLVVVDEFGELLADEAGRQCLHELVSITRIGRALGVHLLLVTQNFEGQLPPQIEANAGLRLCLRVVKAAHSQVVLGSGLAAELPADAVGRGYARLSGGDPIGFRSARVMSGVRAAGPPATVRRAVTDRLPTISPATPLESTDAVRVAELMHRALARGAPRGSSVPWPPRLPDDIDLLEVFGPRRRGEAGPNRHPVGLEDRPDEQRHEILELAVDDRHLLLVGPPTSGASDALVTIATSAALLQPPGALHLFGLDLDGSGLHRLSALPHCGAVATRDDVLAARILAHVHREVDRRRSRPGIRPQIMVLVSGADRLVRRGDDLRSPLLPHVLGLAADTFGTGVQLLVAGHPSILDSRLASLTDRIFCFDGPVTSPRSLLAVESPGGRRVLFARVGPLHDRLGTRMHERFPAGEGRGGPSVIRTVAWPLPLDQAPDERPPYDDRPMAAIGVDTTTGSLVWADGTEDGPLLVVTGPPRSGRSTALASIAALARSRGVSTVAVAGSRRSPVGPAGPFRASFDLHLDAGADQRTTGEALRRLADDRPAMLFVDDAHRLSGDLDLGPLSERFALVVLAGPAEFVDGRSDLRRRLPPHRSGLVLCPTSALDGMAVGLRRLEDSQRGDPRPGRGLLSLGGDCFALQVLDPT